MVGENYISEIDLEWQRKKATHSPATGMLKKCYIENGLGIADIELIKMHVDEHLSAAEIGRRIGVWGYYVGIRLRVLKVYQKGKRALSKKLNDKHIKFLHYNGYTTREIGKIMDVSHHTIVRHLKRMNITLGRGHTPVGAVKLKILKGIVTPEALKKFAHKKKTDDKKEGGEPNE
jgi:hypothetical protein